MSQQKLITNINSFLEKIENAKRFAKDAKVYKQLEPKNNKQINYQKISLKIKPEELNFLGQCYVLHYQIIKFCILVLLFSFIFSELPEIIIYGSIVFQQKYYSFIKLDIIYDIFTRYFLISTNIPQKYQQYMSAMAYLKCIFESMYTLTCVIYSFIKIKQCVHSQNNGQKIQHYTCLIKGNIDLLNLEDINNQLLCHNIKVHSIQYLFDIHQVKLNYAFLYVETPSQKQKLLGIYGKKWYNDLVQYIFFEEYFPKKLLIIQETNKYIIMDAEEPDIYNINNFKISKIKKYIKLIFCQVILGILMILSLIVFEYLYGLKLVLKMQVNLQKSLFYAIVYTIMTKICFYIIQKLTEYRNFNNNNILISYQLNNYLVFTYFVVFLIPQICFIQFKNIQSQYKSGLIDQQIDLMLHNIVLTASFTTFIGMVISKTIKHYIKTNIKYVYHKYLKKNLHKLTQEQLNKLYQPPELIPSKNINSSIKVFILCFSLRSYCYLSSIMGCIYLIVDYWIEKYMLLRVVKQPQYLNYKSFMPIYYLFILLQIIQQQVESKKWWENYITISQTYQIMYWYIFKLRIVCCIFTLIFYYYYLFKSSNLQNTDNLNLSFSNVVKNTKLPDKINTYQSTEQGDSDIQQINK